LILSKHFYLYSIVILTLIACNSSKEKSIVEKNATKNFTQLLLQPEKGKLFREFSIGNNITVTDTTFLIDRDSTSIAAKTKFYSNANGELTKISVSILGNFDAYAIFKEICSHMDQQYGENNGTPIYATWKSNYQALPLISISLVNESKIRNESFLVLKFELK